METRSRQHTVRPGNGAQAVRPLKRRSSLLLLAAALLIPAPKLRAQTVFTQIHSFGAANQVGVNIQSLIRGPGGELISATAAGVNGASGAGIIRFGSDGTDPHVILSFSAVADGTTTQQRMALGSDGVVYAFFHPVGSSVGGGLLAVQPDSGSFKILLTADAVKTRVWSQLVEGSDGRLYAIAAEKLVAVNRDGTGFQVIHTNQTSTFGPSEPALLLESREGVLYVTDTTGGDQSRGVIYRLNHDGSGRKVLVDFNQLSFELGSNPHQLLQGSDGVLYGVAVSLNADGSVPSLGSPVFRLTTDTAEYQVIGRLTNYLVPGPAGVLREGGHAISLLEADDGLLYGATDTGSTNRAGAAFRLPITGGVVQELLAFPTNFTLLDPGAGVNRSMRKSLIAGGDGRMYGSADNDQIFRFSRDGSGFEVTYDLRQAPPADGRDVSCALTIVSNLWLFGTTRGGGTSDLGTVFRMHQDGTGFTILHHFTDPKAGSQPIGGLTLGGDGQLYGTCYSNGVAGVGTVFRLSQDGSEFQVLRSFVATGGDGRFPVAQLLQASDGKLYGTTFFGGGAAAGSLYAMNPDGSGYSITHRFTNNVDGANPSAKLLEGDDARLYGTTETNGPSGQGVVFALQKDGAAFTLLHAFGGGQSGLGKPQGALVQAADRTLYGTAAAGGAAGFGGIFALGTDGSNFRVLHEFSASNGDGRVPVAGLAIASDGLLYGVTEFGGGQVNGSVFKLHPDGTLYEKVLAFSGTGTTGGNPAGALALDQDGSLFGSTRFGGGPSNAGTVFKISFANNPVSLSIVQTGDSIIVRWPASSNGMALEFTSAIGPGALWQPATVNLTTSNGAIQATLARAAKQGFYRLVKR